MQGSFQEWDTLWVGGIRPRDSKEDSGEAPKGEDSDGEE